MAVFVKMESISIRVHVQRIQLVQNVKNVSDLSHQSSYLNMTWELPYLARAFKFARVHGHAEVL